MTKKKHTVLMLSFVIVSCTEFPIYDFGKHYTYFQTGLLLFLNVICYLELGIFEKYRLKLTKVSHAMLLNLGVILAGMVCRYLLEWGRVSNTYNFTIPNVILHIAVTFTIGTLSYLFANEQD